MFAPAVLGMDPAGTTSSVRPEGAGMGAMSGTRADDAMPPPTSIATERVDTNADRVANDFVGRLPPSCQRVSMVGLLALVVDVGDAVGRAAQSERGPDSMDQ